MLSAAVSLRRLSTSSAASDIGRLRAAGAGPGCGVVGTTISNRSASGPLHHWGSNLPTTTISSGTPRGGGLLKFVPQGRFSAISAGTKHATALRPDARIDADTIVDRVIPDRP